MCKYYAMIEMPTAGVWCPYPGCQFQSRSKCTLVAHSNQEHIGFGQFSCPACSERFTSFAVASSHIGLAHPAFDSSHARRPPTVLLEDISDDRFHQHQRPFLTVRNSTGETDLFLQQGGVITAQARLKD
jgi:hypothetical protein